VRTKLPPVLAAIAAACLILQAPAIASQTDLERRRDRVSDDLESARSGLTDTRAQRDETVAELEQIDRKRTALEAELDKLTSELDSAEAKLAEAEQALRTTRAEIGRNTDELEQTERDLEQQRDQLRARVRATFMHGGVSYPEAVLDIDAANDLGASLQYMQAMVSADQRQAQQIEALERKYEAALERLDGLRAAQDEARATRGTERDRVAELVDERQQVATRLEEQAGEREALLAELESDADRYAAAIDDLEAESDAIKDQLAEIAAAEEESSAASTPSSGAGTPEESSGSFQWPVNGTITSGFGYRTHPVTGTSRLHAGVDFGAPTGTPIVAAAAGTVVSAGWQGGYGNAVIIDHGGGEATLYGHQSRLAVSSGTRVSRGEVIGYVGSTGLSTGPHLHFELRIDGVPTDPMPRL
jgi:murein DD-endopeptidase MepM/ murein hydrolase activator NlpD